MHLLYFFAVSIAKSDPPFIDCDCEISNGSCSSLPSLNITWKANDTVELYEVLINGESYGKTSNNNMTVTLNDYQDKYIVDISAMNSCEKNVIYSSTTFNASVCLPRLSVSTTDSEAETMGIREELCKQLCQSIYHFCFISLFFFLQ